MVFTPTKSTVSNALHDARVCRDPSSGGDKDGSCSLVDSGTEQLNASGRENHPGNSNHNEYSIIQHDLATAARYYRLATERPTSPSPRAHYNLGFMYEWGLGLKQDFPLAKRHYDLAISSASMIKEADVPVSIALKALILHEYIVKLMLSWQNWAERRRRPSNTNNEPERTHSPKLPLEISSGADGGNIPAQSEGRNSAAGHPVPGDKKPLHDDMLIETGNPVLDIILYHLLTFESLLILILTIAVYVLIQMRYARQTHR
jgi:SEL1 protein